MYSKYKKESGDAARLVSARLHDALENGGEENANKIQAIMREED